MAKTIPQLTDATTVNAADELIVQQGGITKRATAEEMFSSSAINAGIKNQLGLNVEGNNQDFSQNNAVIHRLKDKILIGGATDHAAAFPATVSDWLGTFQKDLSLIQSVGQRATANTTSGSPVVSFTAGGGGIVPVAGKLIFGPTIPSGTRILAVDSATQLTMNANATATATNTTVFSNRDDDKLSGTASGVLRCLTGTAPSGFSGLFGSQSLNASSAGTSCIGVAGFAVNNNATLATSCWGGYFEAFRLSNTVTGTRGVEIDVVSTTTGEILPNAFQQSNTACLQLGAGNGLAGELPSGEQVNIGAAIQIVSNPMQFRAGIVFLNRSIAGTDGYTGVGPAIRMAGGHMVEWHNPSQEVVARLFAEPSMTSAQRTELRFNSQGIQFVGSSAQTLGFIFSSSTTVNRFGLHASNTGNPIMLSAEGTDTDIDIRLNTKGSGVVRYGTHAAVTTETLSGFITIKDSAGNTRKLAVVS